MKLLALGGSQRARSMSGGLLQACRALAPAGVEVAIFEEHKRFPLFDPDMEPLPAGVRGLRAAIDGADALLIASPEYAHGVTGTIKNTLDWLVSHPTLDGKPVAVLNPSYQSEHADAALKETLRTMSLVLIEDACLRIPVIGSGVAHDAIAASPRFAGQLEAVLAAIVRQLGAGR